MAQRDGETELIPIFGMPAEFNSQILLAMFDETSTRTYMLLFGLAAFSGGVLLMFRHQRSYQEASRATNDSRIRLFERRKFRRRMTSSSMIGAIGVMLSALAWATDPLVFSILVSLVLVALLGVLGLAFLDLFSVGLQQIARPDESARKELVDELLRRRDAQNTGKDNDDEKD